MRTWSALLAVCALLITGAEAVLLEAAVRYFSDGVRAVPRLESLPQLAGFFASSVLLDAVFVLGIWLLLVPLLAALRVKPLQTLALACLVPLSLAGAFDFLRYEVRRHLADLFDLDVVLAVAGGRPVEILAQAYGQILPVVGIFVLAVAAMALGVRMLGRSRKSAPTPRTRVFALSFSLALLAGCSVLPGVCLQGSPICYGLRQKPAGIALASVVERVSDVDFDGYGLLSLPRDPAPFDGTIHPYAIDEPGNGIDENGLAGDHPLDFAFEGPTFSEQPAFARRPHVLIVLLESFRADAIGSRLDGKPVTPFMERLAAEGASSGHAYAHTPYTMMARGQLFGGRLQPKVGQSSLVDDFRFNGYTVALYSAQDDSFADSEQLMGVARAHAHYDARQDRERRTSRAGSPGSLAVSWKLLNERVFSYLDDYDAERPLLLYVNYHDTHFPYHHDELDDILGVDPLPRGEIGPEQRERLARTYSNAAANVDRAVERLVERVRARLGDSLAVLITSDHGQSLYESGFVGHGHALIPEQTRVPLVLWGMGGDWPEPIGLSELRGQLQRSLSVPSSRVHERPRLVPRSGREVLLFTPFLGHPRRIALQGLLDRVRYDVGLNVVSEPASPNPADLDRLIWTWEAAARNER